MEAALGVDLGDIRIHADPIAEDAAEHLATPAFAVGEDVFVASGALAAGEPAGRDLLARVLAAARAAASDPAHGGEVETVEGAPPPDPAAEEVTSAPAAASPPRPLDVIARRDAPSLPARPEAAPVPAAPGEPEAGGPAKATDAAPAGEGPVAPEGAAEVDADIAGPPPAGAVEPQLPPAPTRLSPAAQARVRGAQQAAGQVAATTSELPTADASTASARGAVEEPEGETTARAELRLTEALSDRPEPSPQILELCAVIRASIRDKRPVDEDDLVKADLGSVAVEAGGELNAAVEGDSERVQTAYAPLEEPQRGEPVLDPHPIDHPPETVALPSVDADTAIPDPVPAEDVSLDADLARVDADLEAAGMRREPAELVREGPIADARGARGELEAAADRAPAEVLAAQDAALREASADMDALRSRALDALEDSRTTTVRGVGGQQGRMVGSEEGIRTRISTRAREIFTTARDRVQAQLEPLPRIAMAKWEAGVDRLAGRFRAHLDEVQRWIDERHSGFGGRIVAGWDALTGLPRWVSRAYDRAEQRFGDGVCELIIEISTDVNTVVAICERIIDDAREDIDELFTDLPEELAGWAEAERAQIQGQLDALHGQVLSTRDDFNRDLARRAVDAVRDVQAEIEALRAAAGGLLGRIADAVGAFLDDPARFIIEGLLKLVGIAPSAFWALVDRVKQVVADIADDPRGFVNNLVAGVGQGFSRFFDRIHHHLLQGLLDWLFGGLRAAGVTPPTDLSLGSVVAFLLELMGITWARIRQLLVRHVGEQNVALVERAWSLVATLVQKGAGGVFDLLRDRLEPRRILSEVLDAAVNYVTQALIRNVTARVLALFNPAGAILQAIQLIYRVLEWVFRNAARLFAFVETVVAGLADIVRGNVTAMAGAVESALGRLVAPVIDFLAGLIGVRDLPSRVADTVQRLRDWVESILDRVIGWLVEQGKRLLAAVGLGREDEGREEAGADLEDTELGTEIRFSAAGESHRHWIEVVGGDATLMLASRRETLNEKLNRWEASLEQLATAELRTEAGRLIPDARTLYGEADAEADALAAAYVAAAQAQAGGGPQAEPLPSDDRLERRQQVLVTLLQRLFEIYGEDVDPVAVYAAQLEMVHRAALATVERALRAIVSDDRKLPDTWEAARTGMARDATVTTMLATPLNQHGNPFGSDFAHDWAAAATLDGVNAAFADRRRPDGEPHRRINAVYEYLAEQGGVTGDRANAAGAERYLVNHKTQLHGEAPPFNTSPSPVSRVRDTVWQRTVQGAARIRIRETMEARVRMGIGPPPGPELPAYIRQRVWELLEQSTLKAPYGTTEVHIELSETSAQAITSYIESEIATTGPALRRTLQWWRDNLLAPEFHHAWPQWLGGPAEQTRITIPRALHNFDGLPTDRENFPGGFHQVFNALFRDAFDVPVNDEDAWRAEVARSPEAMRRCGELLVQAYKAVFGSFGTTGQEAVRVFVAEAKRTYPDID